MAVGQAAAIAAPKAKALAAPQPRPPELHLQTCYDLINALLARMGALEQQVIVLTASMTSLMPAAPQQPVAAAWEPAGGQPQPPPAQPAGGQPQPSPAEVPAPPPPGIENRDRIGTDTTDDSYVQLDVEETAARSE